MTIDILERVTAYRPTPGSLDAHWPQPARRAMVEQILADPNPATPAQRRSTRPYARPRRLVTACVLTAGAAAASIVVPVALPSRSPGAPAPAGASTLDELPVIAARQAPPTRDGYRHAVTEVWRTVDVPKKEIDESWTSYDGHV